MPNISKRAEDRYLERTIIIVITPKNVCQEEMVEMVDVSFLACVGGNLRLGRPDAMPHPAQLLPVPLASRPVEFYLFGIGAARFAHLELEDIERLQTHPQIRDDDTVYEPPYGIEPVGKPLKPFDGPSAVDTLKEALVTRVMFHLDRSSVVKEGIVSLKVSSVVHGQDTPQQCVERRRDGQHLLVADTLSFEGCVGNVGHVELGAHTPHEVEGGQGETNRVCCVAPGAFAGHDQGRQHAEEQGG